MEQMIKTLISKRLRNSNKFSKLPRDLNREQTLKMTKKGIIKYPTGA